MFKKSLDFSVAGRYLPYLKKYPKEIFAALFCGIIGGCTSVVMTYFTGKGVDTMIGKNRVDFGELGKIIFYLLGILIVSSLTQWIVQILGNRVAYQSVAALRKDTFYQLNQLPVSYYDKTSHGNIMSRFTNDLDFVSEATAAVFSNVFSGMTIVLIALIFMFYLSPIMTVIVLITTPIIFLVTYLVARSSQGNFSLQQKIVGEISGFVSEIVGNQKIVKAFQYETISQERFEEMNGRLYVQGQKAQFSSSLTHPLSRFVDHLSYIAIGLVGGLLVLSNTGNVTVGIISSFTIYSTQFSKPFIELSGITTQIQTALAGLERTFQIIDTPAETPDAADAQILTHAKGKVAFNHVDFAYTPSQPLIQDLSLSVYPGETVAIVGKTGAGKSTLVNLLMRFYDIQGGSITIDDVDIREYTRDSLRKSFGMVLQDTWLFDGTIAENLAFGKPEATRDEIVAAAKTALVHSFIEKLPQGYDTVIGASGIKISAGQRQLLTIARTMVSNPPMLILDEATSSIDTLTEQKIQTAFLRIMTGKTSFIIAHRLSTIREADMILVMDNGSIVEMGKHHELLNKENGYYRKLYDAQFANETI